jgi:hypothetical protein
MGDNVTVTLRKLVEGQRSLEALAGIPMNGKAGYAVGKNFDILTSAVAPFNRNVSNYMRTTLKVVPTPDGSIMLDPKSKTYAADMDKLQIFRDKDLDDEKDMSGVIKVKYEDLLAAIESQPIMVQIMEPVLDDKGKPTGEEKATGKERESGEYKPNYLPPAIISKCLWFILEE